MLRKGAISIVEQVQEQFLSSIFLLKKRDGGGGKVFFLLKEMLRPGSEGCIFYNFFSKGKSEICRILMDGPDVRLSLSMFWSAFSTMGFCKVNENPHLSFEKVLCQNYKIPRRYAPYGNLLNIPPVSGFPKYKTRDAFPAAKIRKEWFRKVFNVLTKSHFSNFEVE